MGKSTSGKVSPAHWRNMMRATLIVAFLFVLGLILVPLPNPLFTPNYASTLWSKQGKLLSASIASDFQWRFPPADSVPSKFKTALLLYEDEYFFYHPGINPISITRAIKQNLGAREVVSGGSTLSMQTVRMAYGNRSRTYGQKILEMLATVKLELFYSKDEILTTYINHAPFGGNVVGLQAAAFRYFGRPPQQLSWAESAMLAVLPNSPGLIFPGKNNTRLIAKRDRLLHKVYDRGFIDSSELILSKAEPLPSKIQPLPNHAPHLLQRAIKEHSAGRNFHTTLDHRIQTEAVRKLNQYSARMALNEIHNAAAIILDVSTGATLAYVGNSDHQGDHGKYVDVITARRSPGSLLKPFLYAAALDDGLILPDQLLPDTPIFYHGFAPKNFDKAYRGAVPASEALTSSLNVPFVHLLIKYGHERFLDKLRKIGFQGLDKPANHYGLSLILGGGETSLWEISAAYANMGRALQNFDKRPYKNEYSNDDYHDNYYLQDHRIVRKPRLHNDGHFRAASLNYTLTTLTQLNRPEEENGWEYFGNSPIVSWKTGTSFGFRDGWAIGLTRDYLVGIWIGNADGEGRAGLTGIRAAAPLMFDLFDLLDLNDILIEPIGKNKAICAQSGMLKGKLCDERTTMPLPNYMGGQTCTFHQILNLDINGQHQVNSSCYDVSKINRQSWFVLPAVQAWYYRRYHPNFQTPPSFLTACETENDSKLFQLIYPSQLSHVLIPLEQDGKKGQAIFEAAHQVATARVYWHLDNHYIGMTEGRHQMGIQTASGSHMITLIDDLGNEISQLFTVE